MRREDFSKLVTLLPARSQGPEREGIFGGRFATDVLSLGPTTGERPRFGRRP
jgi:hypothetical protein